MFVTAKDAEFCCFWNTCSWLQEDCCSVALQDTVRGWQQFTDKLLCGDSWNSPVMGENKATLKTSDPHPVPDWHIVHLFHAPVCLWCRMFCGYGFFSYTVRLSNLIAAVCCHWKRTAEFVGSQSSPLDWSFSALSFWIYTSVLIFFLLFFFYFVKFDLVGGKRCFCLCWGRLTSSLFLLQQGQLISICFF